MPVCQGHTHDRAATGHQCEIYCFSRKSGAPPRPAVFTTPALLLKLAMGESACLLLEGQKVLSGKRTAAGHIFQFASLDVALGNLFGR